MTRLLLALDGTQPAQALLDELKFLPAPGELELLLMHCLDLNSLAGPPIHHEYEQHLQAKQKSCQDYLDRERLRLNELGYSQIQTHLVIGSPRQSILETAQSEHADLIVLQTHGRSGLQWLILGSVAEGVIRRSTCPVLVLPPTSSEP